MNRLVFLLAGCLVFQSCSTTRNLQKDRLKIQTHQEVVQAEKVLTKVNEQALDLTMANNTDSYAILIKPQGVFSYHPQQGFKGTATSIWVKGSATKLNSSLSLKQQHQEVNKQKQVKQSIQQKELVKMKTVQVKRSTAFWWYVIILIGLLAFYYYAKRHFARA